MVTSAKKQVVIHDQTNLLEGHKLIVVFSALAAAMLITYIDQNSIGVALPTIGRELNSASTIVWAGTSSLIANTAFQVLYGRLSDIFGRKVILVTSLCLLAVADVLCGFAQTGPQLYAFRAISGIANGGIMALVMMVVSDIVTLEERGRYQGITGSCVGLGNTIGPFIAAGFTTHVTWRATFWFIAPLALGVAVLLYFLLPPQTIPPESLASKLCKIDWIGGLTSSLGTILLLVPISGLGTQFEASSPMVIVMITLGAFLFVCFVLCEWKLARLPMLPLRLFNDPALAAMMAQSFLIGLVYQSLLYYLPIYFQSALQLDLITSAALLLPTVTPQAIASALSGQYISRVKRYGEVIWFGYICWTTATGLHCLFDRSLAIGAVAVILTVEGWGIGCVFQPTLVAAQAHSPKQDRAVVIAARNFIRALGGAVGLAISSAIFSNTLLGRISDPLGELPGSYVEEVRRFIVEVPDLSELEGQQQDYVLDSYVFAARSTFYLWLGAMSLCLVLMLLIKDEGLSRQEEVQAAPNGVSLVGRETDEALHGANNAQQCPFEGRPGYSNGTRYTGQEGEVQVEGGKKIKISQL